MSRASALEGQLNKSEAALSTALSQNAALTSELADVNSLLAKVCTACFSVGKKEVCVLIFFDLFFAGATFCPFPNSLLIRNHSLTVLNINGQK